MQAQGELDEAEALLTEAAGTAKQVLGSDHPHTKIFEINLKGLRTAKMKREKTKQLLAGKGDGDVVMVKAEAASALQGMKNSSRCLYRDTCRVPSQP